MIDENVSSHREVRRNSYFRISLLFVVLYLILAIVSDVFTSLATSIPVSTPRFITVAANTGYVSRGLGTIAGIFFLITFISQQMHRKGLIITGSILLTLSILPAILDLSLSLFYIPFNSAGFFYFIASTNVLYLVTGVLALTLIFVPISRGWTKAMIYAGFGLRALGSIIAMATIYEQFVLGNDLVVRGSSYSALAQLPQVFLPLSLILFLVVILVAYSRRNHIFLRE